MIDLKICIAAGHTKSGAGSGAVYGKYKESEITREVASELIVQLRRKGHNVINATIDKALTQNDYLRKQVNIANESNADIFICIHVNAGGGYGCETYTWKGQKVNQAVKICEEMNKLGFYNRGIKDGSGLYVIKHTKMTAILIELFFIDDKTDLALYNIRGKKGLATAILKAIV